MSFSYDPLAGPFVHGMTMAIATILLTIVLEVLSFRTVQDLLAKHPKGRVLYVKAITLNIANHLVLGVPIYVVSEKLFCSTAKSSEDSILRLPALGRVLLIVLLHSIGYYFAHKAMHTVPGLYKYHAFHHRFKEFIPPSAANAVSPTEYVLAYILPFAIGAGLATPSPKELQCAVSIVSLANLLVHMPAMEAFSQYLEPFLVSASSHKLHHNALTRNFAAPTLNLDRISEEVIQAAHRIRATFYGSQLSKEE